MPATTPAVLPGFALGQPVGVKGKNQRSDVIHVQEALNTIPQGEGTPATLLSLDGVAGPITCDAIQKFQLKHFGWKLADGRIDPGGATAQLIAKLLVLYGATVWNVRRLESAVASGTNVADVRTIHSKDRIFEIADTTGQRRCLYHFRPATEAFIPRAADVPALRERPEFNIFHSAVPCGPHAFVSAESMYTEFSPTPDRTLIQLLLNPRAEHVSNGPLSLQVNHEWIKPTTTPGVHHSFPGVFSFLRDDSTVGQKRPRR